MSIITEVTLTCDGCGREFGGSATDTATQQRFAASKAGWVSSKGNDLCGSCRPRRKDGQVWGTKEPKKKNRST